MVHIEQQNVAILGDFDQADAEKWRLGQIKRMIEASTTWSTSRSLAWK